MEELLAYSYLWTYGFCDKNEYNEVLDQKFLINPTDETLLKLEECSHNYKETFTVLYGYFVNGSRTLDTNLFGKVLFGGLERIYNLNVYTISEFAKKGYQIWEILPESIDHEDPFFALCYADDPLSWGDENQTRNIYEELFKFYKE